MPTKTHIPLHDGHAPADYDGGPVEGGYLINKRGLWYRPNSQGYTSAAIEAGHYTKEEALAITHPNGIDGPRDGMFYVHIDEVKCPHLAAHRARITELEVALAEMTRLRDGWKAKAEGYDTIRNALR